MARSGPSTTAVHAGADLVGFQPRPAVTPIVHATTFKLSEETYRDIEKTGGSRSWWYSRLRNPTVASVSAKIAALEETETALLFASGNAAIATALFALARPSTRLVAARELYGETQTLITRVLPALGIETALVPVDDLDGWDRELRAGASVAYVETLSNPMLRVAELDSIGALARDAGAIAVVDSTFASPYNVRPGKHGFDVVLHSATKYLAGHSDLVAGAAAGSNEVLDRIRRHADILGACLDPRNASLLERSVKTLALRMERHNTNALAVAAWLEGHPSVEAVFYPFLPSHPDHAVARRLLRGGSGIVTLRIRGGDDAALSVLRRLKLILEASSLGGVESLASAPFNTSHAALTPREREDIGIHPGTIRLSLGIEDAPDLISDLKQALEQRSPARRASPRQAHG